MAAYRLVTFDAYTALFDRDSSLAAVLQPILGPSAGKTEAMVQLWRAKQMECLAISNSLQKGRMPFRTATRLGLDYAARRFGVALSAGQRMTLVEAWNDLRPWPEAERVLSDVRARGYPIALLSNGDSAMLEALARRIAVPFDHVFSSEQAGTYKPHPALYHCALRATGLTGREVLHVPGSSVDALGAKAAGLRCAWSNRTGDAIVDPAYAPDFEFPTLEGLLNVLP